MVIKRTHSKYFCYDYVSRTVCLMFDSPQRLMRQQYARTNANTHTRTHGSQKLLYTVCTVHSLSTANGDEIEKRKKNVIPYATSNEFGDCNEYIDSFANSSKCIFAFRVRRRWRTTQLMNVVERSIQRLLNFSLNLVFFHLPSCQFSIDFSI